MGHQMNINNLLGKIGLGFAISSSPMSLSAGPDTVIEIYRQWSYQCQFSESQDGLDQTKNCELTHQIRDDNNQVVVTVIFSAVSLESIDSNATNVRDPAIRATIVTPLGVDLQVASALTVEFPNQEPNTWYGDFARCIGTGCFSEFALSESELELFKTTSSLVVSFGTPNPQTVIEINLPTEGLADAIGVLADGTR